jgi:hypothetical protein
MERDKKLYLRNKYRIFFKSIITNMLMLQIL